MANPTNLKFRKVATIPNTLVPGTVYFEKNTGMIKVATTDSSYEGFSGVREVAWNASTNVLSFVRPDGSPLVIDFDNVITVDELISYINDLRAGIGFDASANSYSTANRTGTHYIDSSDSSTVLGALKTLDAALFNVDNNSGVISIGGAKGVITLKTNNTSTGYINLSMDNSVLSASIVDTSSAAYKTVEYFVGTSADTSANDTIKGAKAYTSEVLGTSGDASTANTVHGAINKAEAVKTELLGTVGDASNIKTIEGLTTKINDTSTNATLHLYSGTEGTTVATHVKADGQIYRLVQGTTNVATFNIEKDSFVQDASVVYFATDADASAGTGDPNAKAGHYIHLVIKTSPDTSGGGTTEKDIWIPAETLVDSYTAYNPDASNAVVTVNNDNNTISIFVPVSDGTHLIQHNGAEVTLATIAGQTVKAKIASLENTADNTAGGVKITETVTSGNAELSARIVDGAVTTAKIVDGNVTEAKLSSGVSTKLNGAVQTVTGETAIVNPNNDYINVKVSATKTGTDVSLGTTYSLVTHDVSTAAANANGLATANDVKTYVQTYVAEQLVWAQFD